MTQTLAEVMERLGALLSAYWENDLEMGLEHFFARSGWDGLMDEWVSRHTRRQVNVLCMNLGLDGAGSVRSKKDSLRSCDDELLSYLLVDQFAKYKSKIATIDSPRESSPTTCSRPAGRTSRTSTPRPLPLGLPRSPLKFEVRETAGSPCHAS